MSSICGVDCSKCFLNQECGGCLQTGGSPFRGGCVVAACCRQKGWQRCSLCAEGCCLKSQLIAEFNALGIADMESVTSLNALKGSFVNLAYTLPGGAQVKLLDDDKIYLGNQVRKENSDRYYGLAADENHLLVCEYGQNGGNAELVIYKRRR